VDKPAWHNSFIYNIQLMFQFDNYYSSLP